MAGAGRVLVLLVVLLLAVPVVVVLAALQPAPVVEYDIEFTETDARRARELLKTHDPRRLQAGDIRTITLTGDELNLLLRHAGQHLLPGAVRLILKDGRIMAEATATVPPNPLGRYLNLTARLDMTPGTPRLTTVRLGTLPVPATLANLLLTGGHQLLERHDAYRQAVGAINGIRVAPGRLHVVYQWRPELVDEVQAMGRELLPRGEIRRLLAYHERLVAATRGRAGRSMALGDLLGPMFQLARNRSLGDNDPAVENRSALVVLALYIQGVDLPRLLGVAPLTRPTAVVPLLAERQDLAQHFLISAGIAVAGGGGLADAVGLLKEVDDARYGSGFSFTDLAADRAGVRFAQHATGSAGQAREIQTRMATGVTGDQLLPDLTGLDEFLGEDTFRRRYESLDSPAYRRVIEDIEARIGSLPLYR